MPAKKKATDTNTVAVSVFVPCGRVPAASIYRTALEAVRDAIPVVYELSHEITNTSEVKTDDSGKKGRDYEVTFTYTPRKTTDDGEEVKLDKVIDSLKVPSTTEELKAASGGEQASE